MRTILKIMQKMSGYFFYKKILLFLFLNIFVSIINIFNEENKIKFEQLTTRHGLSESKTTSIIQDNKGFLWIGTEDGLNKYDGYNFTIYKKDNYKLTSNQITSICEDHNGVFWIGTDNGGLNKFDKETENFHHYKYYIDDIYSISSNKIKIIYEDSTGTLWIGTNGGGLNRFDRSTSRFYHYKNNANYLFSLSNDKVTSIYEDSTGILWIGTDGGGLNKFDQKTGRFYYYKNDPKNPFSLSNDKVTSIYEDSAGILWIGTDGGGLNKFDQKTERFYCHKNDPKNPFSLSNDRITTIFNDSAGTLWIGTANGLNIFNITNEKFICYKNQINTTDSISFNQISSIYEDKSGIIWIGTNGGGINKFSRNLNKFLQYNKITNLDYLSNYHVTSIYENDNGILWAGTDGNGLIRYDRNTGKYFFYKNNPVNSYSISNDKITAIYLDALKTLWIGTDGGGLNRLDQRTGKFYYYRYDPDNPYCLSNDKVSSIYEDSTGTLWIGTNGGGLNRFDQKRKRFLYYKYDPINPENPFSLTNDEITSIYEDSTGTLWIGTNGGGLNRYNRIIDGFDHYKYSSSDSHDLNKKMSLSNNNVTSIYEDRYGTLWIGTANGLNQFDQESKTFNHFKQKDGFNNDFIYGILEDNHKNLWISTEAGLSKFNMVFNTICNYDVRDGLKNDKFMRGAYYKNNKNELFFGGTSGLDIFRPEDIKYNQKKPAIVIVDFKIFNNSITPINKIIQNNKKGFKEIKLKYNENVFSFEFAALDFTIPERNHFAYKMDGFDKEWIYSGIRNFAMYTNLNPGKYIFNVKGSNSDYIWNEQGIIILINIIPPYWKTWWFYSICIIGLLALSFTIFNLRINQLKAKNEAIILNNKIKVSTKYQEQLKNFISDVSHEIKTPLSIMRLSIEPVLNSKKLASQEKEKLATTLEMIYSMDFLVKKLLLLSKIENDNTQFVFKKNNLNEILKKVYDTLYIFAKEKKLNFKLNLPHDNISIKSDKDLLFTAFFNIVENSIKYTEKGNVLLYIESLKDKIRIMIEDTGIGISKKESEKIFDRFYRGSYSRKKTKGYGIGLSITKKIIEIHNGQIEVESILNKKTKFIISLPY